MGRGGSRTARAATRGRMAAIPIVAVAGAVVVAVIEGREKRG